MANRVYSDRNGEIVTRRGRNMVKHRRQVAIPCHESYTFRGDRYVVFFRVVSREPGPRTVVPWDRGDGVMP